MTEKTDRFTVKAGQAQSPWPQPTVIIDGTTAPLVTIHPDGRLEYGEGYEPDKAARQFWDALREFAPKQFRRRTASAGEETLRTLVPMFEGLHRLIATSSRDWGEYRVDAWLWAVLCGWECEKDHVHGELCTSTLEEMASIHGWDEGAVAKARRYRAAVRAVEALSEDAG